MKNPRMIIVGAGFTGIGLAIRLRMAGFTNLTIFEQGSRVGGTWWFNNYPGLAVDVDAPLYSYSFELKSDWSREFAPAAEIQQYIEDCVDKYDVRKYIHFDTEVEQAVYNEKTHEWLLTTTDGQEHTCDILLSASGILAKPKLPEIPGIDDFKGKKIHSARWDHTYDFKGKAVAVIGTGASAIQIIPELVDIVQHLTVFQRSAPYVLPKPDFVHGTFFKSILKYIPFTKHFLRLLIWIKYEYLFSPPFLGTGSYATRIKAMALKLAERHRMNYIKDPELLKKVTPDYEMGCKRVLTSNNYYQALTRDNLDLVTDPIERIDSKGVITKSGKLYAVDAIVFSTGYDLLASIDSFEITGHNGLKKSEYFKSVGGPEAYKGVVIANFPNYFAARGPNTSVATMSIIYMSERSIEYIVKAIQYITQNNITYFDVKKEVMDEYNYQIQKVLAPKSIWMTGCSSWYRTEQGKLVAIWPGYSSQYAKTVSVFNPDDYKFKSPI